MNRRRLLALGALPLLVAATACGSSGDEARTSDGSTTAASDGRLPDAPAACAGEGRANDVDDRLGVWSYTKQQLEADPSTPVWLGFSRILSTEEVGDALAPIQVLGVQLVYEQRQGTYNKVIQEMAAAPADSPEVGETARLALGQSTSVSNLLPVGGPDAFEPVDADVRAGHPPFAGVLVTGDVAGAITKDPCLVFSIGLDGGGTAAPLSPAIEPEVPLPDRG